MRYAPGHKEEVHAQIVEEASRQLRRHGLEGVSIPALMKRLKMTHGGFYAHFKGRDELVAEALEFGASETAKRVFEGSPTLEGTLSAYCSPEHVQHPELGCVVAALGTDSARDRPQIRKAFAHAARGLVQLVAGKLGDRPREPSEAALRLTAQMVGAVVLARLVDDPALARRLLDAARKPR